MSTGSEQNPNASTSADAQAEPPSGAAAETTSDRTATNRDESDTDTDTDEPSESTPVCGRCGREFTRTLTVGISGSIGHDGGDADRTCFKPIIDPTGDPAIRLWWHTESDLDL